MKNTYVVKVGDLVIADFTDDIFVMALATCVSLISINYEKQKILATHFLNPKSPEISSNRDNLVYVYPGMILAIKEFEKLTATPIQHCENYLIGGITKEYSQFAREIGDMNVEQARKILMENYIEYHEFVGGKHPKTIHIKNGVLSVKTADTSNSIN